MDDIKSIALLKTKKEIEAKKHNGFNELGFSPSHEGFSEQIAIIEKEFYKFKHMDELAKQRLSSPPSKKYRLCTGSPAKLEPFMPAVAAMKKVLNDLHKSKTPTHKYPEAMGYSSLKQPFVDYLKALNFADKQLNVNNVIYTSSTTQAYTYLMQIIANPGDVILIPAPTYGLFTFIPERIGCKVELIELKAENNWLINIESLKKSIIKINKELKKQPVRKDGQAPKIAAFLNINPHNPLGNVMSNKHYGLLKELGDVCKDNGIFLIDDIIYRDMCYDEENPALPVSTIPNMFDNVISLLGLSKSFGLPGIRAGAVVANEIIINSLRDKIFQDTDSVSILPATAIAGAYNNSTKRHSAFKKYYRKTIHEYKYRLNLVKSLTEGIQTVDNEYKKKIIRDVKKYTNVKQATKLLQGIPGVVIAKGTYPESGFFVLLDFTALKNKWYYDTKISNDTDLMLVLYSDAGIKLLFGGAFAWPNKDEIIGRVAFSVDTKDLIHSFRAMHSTIGKLKE